MKKYLLVILSVFYCTVNSSAQSGSSVASKTTGGSSLKPTVKWSADPFDHQIFIENKGQFDKDLKSHDKVLYQVMLGDTKAYFTAKGVVYCYDEKVTKDEEDKDEDKDKGEDKDAPPILVPHYLNARWEGANPNVTVVAEQERPDYYVYGTGPKSSIKVNIFEKILYKNIYPGIDIEYSFIKGKVGIKYTVIVHPGADVSQVKLKYDGTEDLHLDESGNIIVNTKNIPDITDHAPVSSYAEGGAADVVYAVHGREESFLVNRYDASKTLVIDPWSTSPAYTNYNAAYDIDYDNNGNVYAFGSYNAYQFVKFNSAGVKQWTYTTAFAVETVYGAFCTDRVTGESYIGEGVDDVTGASLIKVSTNGTLLGTYGGNTGMLEIWRMKFNPCTGQAIIGGGGTNTPTGQVAILDTTMATLTPYNPLAVTTCCHDVDRMAVDVYTNTAFFAFCTPDNGNPGNYANTGNALISVPVPALTPFTWKIDPNGDSFLEATSPIYNDGGAAQTNGINGMAVSPNWLYTYDSDSLKQTNKTTGAVSTRIKINTSTIGTNGQVEVKWGGLDADACDDAYVGSNADLLIYNSSLTLLSTTALTSTVFDVKLSQNYNLVYAGGKGYVEALNNPNPITVMTTSEVDAKCDLCNGQASATLDLCGVPATGITYQWEPGGQTTQTATGLCAGTYTCTIKQGCGASFTDTALVKDIPMPTLSTSETYPACPGETGTATVSVTGNTAPYTYTWAAGGQTTATATGLAVGTYTISVEDANGCTVTATSVITQPTIVTPTISASTNVSCNGGDNGSATVTATGGIAPYTYSWASIGGSGATGTGFTAGSYTVTVTTNSGCTGTATVTITQPTLLSATTTEDPATCGSSNGSATVTATGGTAPYNYAWTGGGGNVTTDPNLSTGAYTVTVTDANGCTATSAVTVTSVGGATVTMGVPTNVSCNGGDNGSETATAGGGTAPYTYSWSTAPAQSGAEATGLSAGTYTVTVHDNIGCISTASITITQPTQLTASISGLTYPLCNGGTGTATATATGGTAPYTYGWATVPPQLTATANGLSAGTYTVGVEDNNGCTSTTTAVITQPTAVTASTSMTQGTCGNANGTATVTPGGGVGGYTYGWNPAVGNTATVSGLSAGTYTATVTDANGCTATSAITVTTTPPITISTAVVNNVSCFGGDNGSATATGAGGTAPYQYGWLTTPPQLTQTATGLSAGTYSVGTEDANGCTATTTVTITQPSAITTGTSFTAASCNLYNGSATVDVTGGGTAPFTYSWGTTPVQSTATAVGISAGTYTVLVTDNNGCTTTASVDVTQPSAVTASIVSSTGVSCFGGDNGTATATANGGTGPYGYAWTPIGGNDATGTGFSAGTYTVTAHDINGCISTASVTITQPIAITVNITGPGLVCAGSTATLTANVGGGTAPYVFSWSGAGAAASTTDMDNITPPGSETYTVVVTDANGCTGTANFTTTAGPPVFVSATGASICPGGTATICANASGGTGGGDTYNWEPGNYSDPCITVSPNTTTIYTITVTDNCGTTATATSTVQMNPYPVVNFSADLYTGCAPLCVQFYNNTTLTSGSAESYSWLFGDGDSSHVSNALYCYPKSGVYSVSLTVTSDSGCSATLKKSQLITVYPDPVAAFTMSPQPTTILNPTIQFTNTSTGVYPIQYWFWNFGDGNVDSLSNITQDPTHTYADTGTYCAQLAVMDIHGCTDTVTNCLIIEPIFTLYIPSAFTPNGGGLNETFTAKGVYVKTFSMDIFDRWGEHLYHTDDINAGWNGTVNGGSTVSQEDVYVYKITATDMENNPHNYIGSVTLIK